MKLSFRSLKKLKKELPSSCRISWGKEKGGSVETSNIWFYLKQGCFEIIIYFSLNGKIKSICFWEEPSYSAKYIDRCSVENINLLLDSKNLDLKVKEWILFNLNLFFEDGDYKYGL